MASNSKSVNLDGANSYIRRCVLTAYFNENSTSTKDNTSNITCKASLYTPSASWDNGSGRDDHLRIYWHDNRENYDRLVATWSDSAVGYGATITAEGTIDVTHKDDGTLSGYAYATWSRDGGNTYYAPASGGVSTDWTSLTTIARASQPTIGQAGTNVPDFDIGDTITIYMNRKSSSFTHTVTFNYGNTSVEVATGVANSCTFDTATIANDLYALIPNANVYSNTISVKTYNGSTLIGTKTCAYNAHVVNSDPIIPTGSPANQYYYLNARDTLTRTIFSTNQFIQNISEVNCIVDKTNAMPTAQNGASLVKIICAFAGLTGEILAEDIPASEDLFSIMLGTPTTYGTQTALLTAIDSRGNSTTVVVDAYTGQLVDTGLNYIAQYSAPSIVASCERQSNFENNTTISISGAMTSLKRYNENTECNAVNATNGIQYRYKESTSSTWGSWTNVASTTSADGSVSTTAFVISLDNQKEWDFEFKITDKITSTTITRHVGQGQPQFFIGADGRTSVGGVPQIAIPTGKLGQLEVYGNAYANGNRLAELPITNSMLGSQCVKSNNIDFATLGGIKKLLTVPYSAFGTTQSSAYYFDLRSVFCDHNPDRLFVYDALIIQLDFSSRIDDPEIYLRWGCKETPTNATFRKMFTLSNGSIGYQSVDTPNLIFTSNNELQETLIVTPVSYRSIIRTKTTDEIPNFAVSHYSGVQTAGQNYRLHFGSWLRIQYMPQLKVPMFFDATKPERGNMVVYGLRYPS